MSDQPRTIAEFSDYRGLVRALNAARELRNISFEMMDEAAKMPKGYFSKVLAPGGSRRVTMNSITDAFWTLGIKCLVVDDPELLKLLEGRLSSRQINLARPGTVTYSVSRKFLKKIARKGGVARSQKLSTKRRQAIARKAGKASAFVRWGKTADPSAMGTR